jgi:REP element-mobilizing transposase RayT
LGLHAAGLVFCHDLYAREEALFWAGEHAIVNLSPIGKYADACWKEVPQHHQHIDIDEFVVMPNHIHAIVIIGGPERLPELRKRENSSGLRS